MSITTKQIAAQLGYSQQTVSDVLRRGPKYERYSEATRLRIEQAAAELGYRPNAAAQAMSSGRFNAIGLLMSRHRHQSTVYGELLRGVHDALEEQGIHLTVTFVDDVQLTADDSLPQVLRRAMVDGLLLNYTHGIPQRMSDLIDRHNLPAVWINSKRLGYCRADIVVSLTQT
jgi:LacI family transcriptional regulator